MNRTFITTITSLHILAGCIFAAGEAAGHGDGKVEAGAKDGNNAIKSFRYDAGMKVELWANEPQLANPVAFSPDEKGRWYVSESYRQEGRREAGRILLGGVVDNRAHMNWLDDDIAARTIEDRLAMMRKFYPEPERFKTSFETQEERIVLLEDTKGTGRADKSTVYADGFREALDGTAAGILARGNEVWWTNIPNLWRLTDSDGDGKADAKDKLLTGFGVKFAFRGHDMHGLRFGPDGKVYFSIGDRGVNVKSKEGKQWEASDTGSIMRCNPDGTNFEIFAIGVRNPQELAFDEYGNLFTGDNNSDSGDKARFVQLVEGGDCGWRMHFQYLGDRGPWNRELLWDEKEGPKTKYTIPPIANISNGPSGLTYNPGTGLSAKYAGRFYLCDFRGGANNSSIHEIALEPAGAWHRVKERRDFVKGVLCTDVEFGPDGGLYVLDWVESWSGVNKGRIFKFTSPDADAGKQAEVKKLIADGFTKLADAELEKLLAHEDQRIRQGAQFQLATKGATAVLTNAAQKGASTLARIHGVWGLGQIAAKQPAVLTTVAALLADNDAEVRAQAARVLGDNRFTGANDKLVALLKDASGRARFYAALALGKAAHKPAVEPLFAMLTENADKDPILRHGAVMGLAGCADATTLAAKATDTNASVRVGAVVALRRLRSPLVSSFLRDADQGIILEAARAIYDMPIPEAMPALGGVLANKAVTDRNILLRATNALYRHGQPESAKALAQYAAQPDANEFARGEALNLLTNWANPSPKDRLLNAWRPLPARTAEAAATALAPVLPSLFSGPSPVQEATAAAVSKLQIPGSGDALFTLVANDGASKAARTEALRALTAMKHPRLGAAASEALTDKDPKFRAAGLKALVATDSAVALKAITEVLASNTSAVEKQGAVLALAESNTADAEKLLGGLMDQLIAGKLAPEVQLDVIEAVKKRGGLAEKIQQWKASLPKSDELAEYKIALMGGDAERGKKSFREHVSAQCFKCHKCDGGDSLVGPDLSKIGAQKDRTYILESIIFPNKAIAQGFQIVVLELTDGMTIAGRLLGESGGTLQVETVDAAGKPQAVTVAANKIKTRTSAPSPMPENERDNLTRAELRNIIEYLATRK